MRYQNAPFLLICPKSMSIFETYIQLSYGTMLFQPTFCVFDIKKQLQSYTSDLALFWGG